MLFDQLDKRLKLNGITPVGVIANYSSFVGNLVYRKERLPDPVLASIEIGRRGYEFHGQYVKKTFNMRKNVVLDDSKKALDRAALSLEELDCSVAFEGLRDLYYKLKKTKTQVRFTLDDVKRERVVFSQSDRRRKTEKVCFGGLAVAT
ncbi:MAG: hypothetical protein LBD58_09920 [Treponema sp.]|nr:hypothetical protein [Treponema sp.]